MRFVHSLTVPDMSLVLGKLAALDNIQAAFAELAALCMIGKLAVLAEPAVQCTLGKTLVLSGHMFAQLVSL